MSHTSHPNPDGTTYFVCDDCQLNCDPTGIIKEYCCDSCSFSLPHTVQITIEELTNTTTERCVKANCLTTPSTLIEILEVEANIMHRFPICVTHYSTTVPKIEKMMGLQIPMQNFQSLN